MNVIKKIFGFIKGVIDFIRNVIGFSILGVLLACGYLFLLAIVYFANTFYPPAHWVHLFDHEPLSEEQLMQTAKDLTIKWKAEAEIPVTHEKTDSLKPGTTVKVLAILEFSKDCRLMHEFGTSPQIVVEQPDGKRVLARLPEAAELTRAVVLKTADTVDVLSVSKNKKGVFSYKTSDGKVHKDRELKFLPFTLPAYYENLTGFLGKQFEFIDKIYKMQPHSSLAYVPNGFYKVNHTDGKFNGYNGAMLARGGSGVFDALLMMLFAATIIFIIKRLLTRIPGMTHEIQDSLGVLIFPPIMLLYVLFISGIGANTIIAIIAIVHGVKKNKLEAYNHRCLRCLHGYKLKHLGKVLVDTKVKEGWEHFDDTESCNYADRVTYETKENSISKKEISREHLYKHRRVSGEVYKRRTVEFWEDQFFCSHCNQQSAYKSKEYKEESLDYRNVEKGSWH